MSRKHDNRNLTVSVWLPVWQNFGFGFVVNDQYNEVIRAAPFDPRCNQQFVNKNKPFKDVNASQLIRNISSIV